ncbi:MAG: hypothetical protein JNG88_20020, partial [Phycisphaerales bacterium]|nr:hypothetical protein [Phycisphaerales bacterium]
LRGSGYSSTRRAVLERLAMAVAFPNATTLPAGFDASVRVNLTELASIGNSVIASYDYAASAGHPSPLSGLAARRSELIAVEARRADGVLMAWGGDGNGGLGDGLPYADRGSPGPVTLAAVRHVAAAGRKGAAVDAAGVGWAWGSNGFGEAGIGRLDNVVAPTPVVGASP